MKTTIYLVRHGEYENPDYLFPGRSREGFPLSERGRKQVKTLAGYFVDKPIAAVYSSPILRCKETAEMLAGNLPVFYDDRLLEVRTMADGASMSLFDADPVRSYRPDFLKNGAESMEELTDRMVGFVEEKLKKHEGKDVLIVTHGDPMRFCVMHYLGLPMTFEASRSVPIPLAGGYRIEFGSSDKASVSPIVI